MGLGRPFAGPEFGVWRMFLIFSSVLSSSRNFGDAYDQRQEVLQKSMNQSYWDSLLASHQSILKAMRRHVRWTGNDTVAVTVVYQATQPVSTRWFLGGEYNDDRWKKLTKSEVPHAIPIDGDPNCHLRFTRSGRVTAAVLVVRGFRSRSFVRVHTILTTANDTVQYQLHTDIKPRAPSSASSSSSSFPPPDQIDGPEWLLIPRSVVRIEPGSALDLHCAVFVPNDDRSRSNELTMSRIPLSSDEFGVEKVMIVHKDTQDQTEAINDTLVVGRRYSSSAPAAGHHSVYHIGLSSRSIASAAAFAGVYHCRNERANERLDALFSVLQPPLQPLFPDLHLVSCDETNYRQTASGVRVLTMTARVPTCFRCRAAGRPVPRVAVFRNEDELVARDGVGVTKFVSVGEAWVAEATYTYHDPLPRVDDGTYSCQATNSRHPPIAIKFRIEVKSPR